MTSSIAVFIKYPTPGKVKTRLAASIGPENAAKVYSQLLDHLIRETLLPVAPEFNVQLYCDPIVPMDEYRKYFSGYPLGLSLQSQGDLGRRLSESLRALLVEQDSAIAIGSDCISLTPDHLREAKARLANHDLVLGPATDGGYYLIGMKKLHASLFEKIRWSTDTVLAETLEKASALGLRTAKLSPLSDIDTIEDLKKSGFAAVY